LANLHHEKRLLEDQAKGKIPRENYDNVKPSADRISAAFDEVDQALQ
jgi:hypothetical protein